MCAEEAVPRSGSLALGVYFSALLEFWLRHGPAFRVERFATGTQIVSATNQTVGQLKFLFRCEVAEPEPTGEEPGEKKDLHVESSVKFFLLHPLSDAPLTHEADNRTDKVQEEEQMTCFPLEQFVGPHLAENLAWRVQEVARKLDMCRGDSVRAWLRDAYSEHVSSHIVLRGYLFYPLRLFPSTASVTQSHDWEHHRNTACSSSTGSLPRSHPRIAPDHLAGWWTSDFEAELPAKVSANDIDQCGESRFVVLPKLHWLAPVLAIEDEGSVVVDGEPTLGAQPVLAKTLSELIVFTKTHFESLAAAPPKAPARGAVVMPLLVAEIVRCRPVDQEFSVSVVRWKELSRGFVLDPRCWDPVPLCNEPVRFRKVSQRLDNPALGDAVEWEYASRKEWRHDGVIKPTEKMTSRTVEQPRVFVDPSSVSPSDLVTALEAALGGEHQSMTHAVLKASIKEVLLLRADAERESNEGEFLPPGRFVREALSSVAFELHLLKSEGSSKQTQRVGHLVLDAFESVLPSSAQVDEVETPEDELVEWVRLYLRVAEDRGRWDFLNLLLRALQLVRVQMLTLMRLEGLRPEIDAAVERLVSQEQSKWNAVAVETVSVFSGCVGDSRTQRRTHALFHRLVGQEDWGNAERLTVVTRDPVLLQTIFEHFARMNMTKAMKRLRKASMKDSNASSNHELHKTEIVSRMLDQPKQTLGPDIDHAHNRKIGRFDLSLKRWELVSSSAQVADVVAYLTSLEETVHEHCGEGDRAKKTIIGLDCEWRPQFLRDAGCPSPAADGDEDTDGVSVYQLAVDGRVFVVDVQVLGVVAAAPLKWIWRRSSPFLLTGFCVLGDLKRLAVSFPALMGSTTDSETEVRVIELKRLAGFRCMPIDKWGLSKLYFACSGREVNKEQQCSDWGCRPLTASQVEYAAMDAHAVRSVALHLLADLELDSDQVGHFMHQFLVTIPRPGSSRWLADRKVLGKSHVHAAIRALGLDSAVRFHTISKDVWVENPHHESGLVVKTIAVAIKRQQSSEQSSEQSVFTFAVVVLQLDRIIDMEALAACVGSSSPDDISLADQRTLIRVFGYSRGCVGPIGLRQQEAVRIIVDKRLEHEHRLLCGAGALDEVYSIAPGLLISTVGALTADISTC